MSVSDATDRARHIVLGVGGGIAAYKAVEVLRRLSEAGHDVTVVPTAAALEFVGEPTWAALSHRPVATGVFTDAHAVPHVALGRRADLVVVAPATADLMARAAHGLADDLLTNTLLTARCPVLFAPAMHTEMWEHPATVDNVTTLRRRGVTVLDPAVGRLTGADTGRGRLPEPAEIVTFAELLLARDAALPRSLEGRRIVVTAGGTREPLDPVRYLGNRSSGLQGRAVAAVAAMMGADVTLIAANVDLPTPAGVTQVDVSTAAQLREATLAAAGSEVDAVVMAAAVADFRPTVVAGHKVKKQSADGVEQPVPTIELTRNDDILAELVARRADGSLKAAVIVGFAAETGDETTTPIQYGRAKLAAKGCDLLVVNDVSAGQAFGRADNAGTVLGADGSEVAVPLGPKSVLASVVCEAVSTQLGR